MKKILAILLVTLLSAAVFAAPASAAISGYTIDEAITVNKGFNKNNADYFQKLDAKNADFEFTAESNNMFSIDMETGKMKFNTGFSSLLYGPAEVTVHLGDETQIVKVTTRYEFYEYFVIVFAAGLFWISAVNN
ncbi:MAG: hypothetical protein LBB75_01865 [Oscillospiraceae bacterium]|jgi:hypothetical protein|nr:hypothetical protein [Oscillospiraceae bacterium]